ncbi:MAG: peptide ABC transporter substrate-binding protein [Planctomycetales bacterium]|nr:peptide ABC transporter substrate-binding protein [Planctomycetales bacterium]
MIAPKTICIRKNFRSVFFVGLLVFLFGCGKEPTGYFGTTRPLHSPDELWINNGQEPEHIDPGRCADSAGGEVIRNIFAGLTEPDPTNVKPRPDIASHWEVSDDQTAYTFHLRQSGWSDGTPLTAHDFRWSWLRVLDPKLASRYASNMYIFANGEALHRGALYVYSLPDGTTSDELDVVVSTVVDKTSHSGAARDSESEEDPPATCDSIIATTYPVEGFMVFLSGASERRNVAREKIASALKAQFGDSVVARKTEESDVGLEVADDYTLIVRLENAIPYLLEFLSFYTFMPAPRHVIEDLESKGINPELWTREDYIVSNGAYRMTDWQFRQYMEFAPNEHYWNRKHPGLFKIQKVRLLGIENYNTCLNMYYAGQVDSPGPNTSLPAEFMDHLKQYKDFRSDPYLSVYVYWLNTAEPPLDNVHLRRALSLSIDRESLVKYVTRAGQQPTASFVPDGLAGYKSPDLPLFDPVKAKEELKEAGYADGAKIPPVTLIYNTSEGHKQIAEAIQQMWKEHLGAEITIENKEWNVYLGDMNAFKFQIARLAWNGDYPDPFTYLELFMTECGNNHSNWGSPKYDAMINEANRTLDRQKRLDIMQEAELLALEQQPLIPIYVYTRSTVIKPYLRGFWGNYQDHHPWKFMSIDERWYDEIPTEEIPNERPDIWSSTN